MPRIEDALKARYIVVTVSGARDWEDDSVKFYAYLANAENAFEKAKSDGFECYMAEIVKEG